MAKSMMEVRSVGEVRDAVYEAVASALNIPKDQVTNQTLIGNHLMAVLENIFQSLGVATAAQGNMDTLTTGELLHEFEEGFYALKPWKRPVEGSA